MRLLILLLFSLVARVSLAQTITGKITEEISGESLPEANVRIAGSEVGASADERGVFILHVPNGGRYDLEISFVGFSSQIINNVWVKNGTVTNLNISLERSSTQLSDVVVTVNNSLHEPGRMPITEEQINRYAATYYDPARLATSSPDVAITNDQNNQVSVRGISPSYNVWRLEGAEIVNPNHLSNAGTFLDRPSATGGGVNMLSAQMLSNSAFVYGTYDNTLGNSVSGIFDMHLKQGNNLQYQYTAQASLIGFDLASEGPISKSGATYAVNYRYSFTGLLAGMGVDFGGESIGFQDLSFHFSQPIGSRAKLSVFGVGGFSINDFDHKDFAESEVEKDRNDIYYDNKTGIIGLLLESGFGAGKMQNTLIVSGFENHRDATEYGSSDEVVSQLDYSNSQRLMSWSSRFYQRLGATRLQFGWMLNHYAFNQSASGEGSLSVDRLLFQPYVQLDRNFGEKLRVLAGVNQSNIQGFGSWSMAIDPRISASYFLTSAHTLKIAAGRYTQVLLLYNTIFYNPWGTDVTTLTVNHITSNQVSLSHQWQSASLTFDTELFYYGFPETENFDGTSSHENIQGLSVSAEQSFSGALYFRVGGSLYECSYQPDLQHSLTIALGKTWEKQKADKNRTFGVNLKAYHLSGKYIPGEPGFEVSDYTLGDFFRLDARMIWTWKKTSRTSSLALDLQNLTNKQNESLRYMDDFSGKQESLYSLGMIPILAYRVEW